MLKTDWLKVATAGRTVDGREIKADWLEKMALVYSPRVYTATVNSEHFFYPGLGHVTELRIAKDELGRTALYARIAPTAELLGRYQNRRQLFFSVEVMPDFPAKGDFYLSGLAITDLPASQGLEPAEFRAEATGRQRYFDTSCVTDDEPEAGKGAEALPIGHATDSKETPPGWWTSLWSTLRPHIAATKHLPIEEQEPMTEQERQAFEALKTQVETFGTQLKTLADRMPKPAEAKDPAEPAADTQEKLKAAVTEQVNGQVKAQVETQVAAALKSIVDRLTDLEGYMAEPVPVERGDVTGPTPGNDGVVF